MLGVALLGVIIERLAYKPLRNAPRVSAIITALGVGLFLENFTLALSPYPKHIPPASGTYTWTFGDVSISSLQIIIIAFTCSDGASRFYCQADDGRHGHARHFVGQNHRPPDGRARRHDYFC